MAFVMFHVYCVSQGSY